MKRFSKPEIIFLIVIFLVLIAISWPNFIVSLRRARDQVRRDDMGALQQSLGEYLGDLQSFPPASPDGRIMDCEKPGDKPVKNAMGRWVVSAIPCDWGKDGFINLVNGRVYMSILPRDPDYQKGVKYLYFTDGARYQIFAAMEGKDEAEVDPKIISLGLACGTKTCNIGRSYGCDIPKSIEQCDKEALK